MAWDIYQLGWDLESFGFYDIILPFILVFLISYGILTKVKLFGKKENKPINVTLSLVLAFFAIRTQWIANMMQTLLPRVSMMMLTILMFLLLLAVFTEGNLASWAKTLLIVLCFVGFIYAVTAGTGVLEEVGYKMGFSLDERNLPWIIIFSVAGLAIWAVVGSHEKAGKIMRGDTWGGRNPPPTGE